MRINRQDFLTALEMLQPGLSPKELVEQSSCVVFRNGYMMTFNDEIACKRKSPIDLTGAVAAAPLLALLHKMPEQELELKQAENELRVIGKRRSAGIRMESEVLLPIDTVDKVTEWKPLPENFSEAIGLVQHCAGTDESEFTAVCVHLHPKFVEACDNIRAGRYRLATGLESEACVRRESIKHIVSAGMTKFAETKNWIHFRSPTGLRISCRRWVEEYPSLKEVLSVDGTEIVLPKGLAEAAERADIFSGENAENDQITVELKPGLLRLSGQGSNGWFSERKKVKYDGQPFAFMVWPKILAEIVKEHSHCQITPKRLKISAGPFTFVSCLNEPDQAATNETPAENEENHGDENEAGQG